MSSADGDAARDETARTARLRRLRAAVGDAAVPDMIKDLTRALVAVDVSAAAWRRAEDDVRRAYHAWRSVATAQRPAATIAFLAALDREEQAAAQYQLAWETWCAITR